MSRFPAKRPNMRPSGYSSERARPYDWRELKREFRAQYQSVLDPAKKVEPRKDEAGRWVGLIGHRKDGTLLEVSFADLRERLQAREDRFFSVEGGAQHYTLEGPPGSSSHFTMPESPPPAQYRTPELEGGNAWLLGNLGDSIFRKGI